MKMLENQTKVLTFLSNKAIITQKPANKKSSDF